MAEQIQIRVNGEDVVTACGTTVAGLVESRGLRSGLVAVEVNKEIVPRARHAEETLDAGDRVEIVTLVGGG